MNGMMSTTIVACHAGALPQIARLRDADVMSLAPGEVGRFCQEADNEVRK
jgi:hypothetical protein